MSISLEELQLAARNHGMPLEALRHEITPLGLHYLLTHSHPGRRIPLHGGSASAAGWSASWSCRSTTCGHARR